jgi:O-methyltransferase
MKKTERDLYLDLLKKIIANTIYQDALFQEHTTAGWKKRVIKSMLGDNTLVGSIISYDHEARRLGKDWPSCAHTMVGIERLNNLHYCAETILNENIEGDFIETGVWRGGASIFMRGILKAYQNVEKTVWVADSFQGLPPPKPDIFPADEGDIHHTIDFLRVSLDEVKENFRRYDLLDNQVKFLKGWFSETLPKAPIEKLSILRLDGDMYESTICALSNLYHKLVIGGFVIIDDYCIHNCEKAVTDFRKKHGIKNSIVEIDGTGVFWRKD